jgi:DNA-binding FrmR family transcriptional regulator
MSKKDKSKAESEISRIASKNDIVYVVIEDEYIERYAEDFGVKLTDAVRTRVKEVAFDLLQQSMEQAIEDAFADIAPDEEVEE